jgi:hypothetical protein
LLGSAFLSPPLSPPPPTTQGAGVTGTQGIGVKTPKAAAVAAATVGFDGELHMPKGGIFKIGLLSMMLAAGGPPVMVRFCGKTTRLLGATPKLHWSIAPIQTCIATTLTPPIGDVFELAIAVVTAVAGAFQL